MTRLDGPNMKPSDKNGSKPNFTDKQDALVTNSCPSSSQHVSEVPQKGWTRPQRNVAKLPLRERTGWSPTADVAECVLETWLVSDLPGCGSAAAAPFEELR